MTSIGRDHRRRRSLPPRLLHLTEIDSADEIRSAHRPLTPRRSGNSEELVEVYEPPSHRRIHGYGAVALEERSQFNPAQLDFGLRVQREGEVVTGLFGPEIANQLE